MTSIQRVTRSLKAAKVAAVLLAALAAATTLSAQSTEELRLTVGKSIVLDYPSDIRQISTSDPAIVDAIAITTREILLHAKSTGLATLIIWSKNGQRTIYSTVVEQNLDQLRRLLKETFPNEDIQVRSTRDSISVTGHVSTKDIADRAVALITPFGKTVVNSMRVAPPPIDRQILLRVKFAELNRNASTALGVNIISTGNTIGGVTTGQFRPPALTSIGGGSSASQPFTLTDALNIFAFRPDLNLGVFIKALQGEGLLQILAEPNLVTVNGKEASFLVGGEFPVPILQGGGNAGAVTVQFREFGIRLTFLPVLTENNTIKMYVKPEVSTIDLANAVNFNGFTIPALATRRVETNVELAEGQSFVIGGLLDQRLTETMSKIPGLASIPVLGNIFKSKEVTKNRTELIVLVTPELTTPLNPGDPSPVPAFPKEFLNPSVPNTHVDPAQPAPASGSEKKAAVDDGASHS
jgi:pilus assembly protein CpaC